MKKQNLVFQHLGRGICNQNPRANRFFQFFHEKRNFNKTRLRISVDQFRAMNEPLQNTPVFWWRMGSVLTNRKSIGDLNYGQWHGHDTTRALRLARGCNDRNQQVSQALHQLKIHIMSLPRSPVTHRTRRPALPRLWYIVVCIRREMHIGLLNTPSRDALYRTTNDRVLEV